MIVQIKDAKKAAIATLAGRIQGKRAELIVDVADLEYAKLADADGMLILTEGAGPEAITLAEADAKYNVPSPKAGEPAADGTKPVLRGAGPPRPSSADKEENPIRAKVKATSARDLFKDAFGSRGKADDSREPEE